MKGYTYIEIIIVLFLFSIFCVFAIASFSHLSTQNAYQSAIVLLEQDLKFAKRYADRFKIPISICVSHDKKSCYKEQSSYWNTGWIIFKDINSNFIPTENSIIRVRNTFDDKVSIFSNRNIGNGIHFKPLRKRGKSLGNNLPTGHFIICAKDKLAHKIILNYYGYYRTEKEAPCS